MTRNNHGRIQGRRGVKLRQQRLAQEPLCRECLRQGRITEAVTPDHITPLSKGGTDTDDNVQSLCAGCHAAKTAADLGYKAKPETGADGWPTNTGG